MKNKKDISLKNILIIIFLGIFALFLFFLALSYQQIIKSPSIIWDALFNYDENNSTHVATRNYSLVLLAMIVAMISLSVAGLILQTITRNPLASPGVLGIMGSIKMGATILSFVGIGIALAFKQLILIAFAAIPMLLILAIIKFSRFKLSGLSMIFIGISLGVIFSSLEWFIMYNNEEGSLFIETFLNSNFNLVTKDNLFILSLFVVIPIIIVFVLSRWFTLLSMGEEMSSAVGNNANKVRIVSFMLVAIMVPASILLGGNLLFAGIIAPNISKLLIKNKKFLPMLLSTIFIGIIIIMSTAILSHFIPIHINALLDIVAAPIFIIMARRQND